MSMQDYFPFNRKGVISESIFSSGMSIVNQANQIIRRVGIQNISGPNRPLLSQWPSVFDEDIGGFDIIWYASEWIGH